MELERIISESIEEELFSACSISVYKKSTNIYENYFGKNRFHKKEYGKYQQNEVDKLSLYDLASLTKVFSTSLLIGKLVEENELEFNSSVGKIFNNYAISYNKEFDNVTIEMLLSHSSGIDTSLEEYKTIGKNRSEIFSTVRNKKLINKPGTVHLYSDYDMILLTEIIELKYQKKLNELFREKIANPLNLTMFYIPKNDFCKLGMNEEFFVATRFEKERNKLLIAEVDDPNAFYMDGVSGHAGLFSNIDSVSKILLELLEIYKGKNGLIKSQTLKKLWEKKENTDWAMGVHYKSEGSSGGTLISDNSLGMTGFTGNSFWIDFDEDIIITILSNRVHGTDWSKFKLLRPKLHDAIYNTILP